MSYFTPFLVTEPRPAFGFWWCFGCGQLRACKLQRGAVYVCRECAESAAAAFGLFGLVRP